MPAHEPLVSAIIPVFNGAPFLREAVESIRRQHYEPLEIIVVDDGSTDGTGDVAAGLGPDVRYVRQPNAGPPAARNTGLRHARGGIIGLLDVDDLWADHKLSIQLALLAANPGVDVVLGYTKVVRRMKDAMLQAKAPGLLPAGPVLCFGAALFRRSSFEKVGVFDETLRLDDDVDWFLRAKEGGLSLLIHKDVICIYRRHDANLTNRKDLDNHFFISTLKKSLDRRRQTGGGTAERLPPWFKSEEQ